MALQVNLQRGINSLNYKLSQKRNQVRPVTTMVSEGNGTLDVYLEDAKQKHLNKASWKTLDMIYKWQYLQEYVDSNEKIEQDLKSKIKNYLKQQLSLNNLKTVVYNNKTKKIVTLGLTYKDTTYGAEVPL